MPSAGKVTHRLHKTNLNQSSENLRRVKSKGVLARKIAKKHDQIRHIGIEYKSRQLFCIIRPLKSKYFSFSP